MDPEERPLISHLTRSFGGDSIRTDEIGLVVMKSGWNVKL